MHKLDKIFLICIVVNQQAYTLVHVYVSVCRVCRVYVCCVSVTKIK